MPVFTDLSGMVFGRLKVLYRVDNNNHDKSQYLCECNCGSKKVVIGAKLTIGETKSCGCYRKQVTSKLAKTHGLSNTRLYQIWLGIRRRCNDSKRQQYKNYGARGIKIQKEWETDFVRFYEWSMNNGYSDDLSIDRIDNDKSYSEENCRWATREMQANNTSKNHFITFEGRTHTLIEWSRIKGINYSTIRNRVRRGAAKDKIFAKVGNPL